MSSIAHGINNPIQIKTNIAHQIKNPLQRTSEAYCDYTFLNLYTTRNSYVQNDKTIWSFLTLS